jgi:hypothetical protein
MKNLAPRQLAIAAGGALVVAGAMLSHDNRLGYAMLAVSVLCGIGAFAKAKDR